MPGHAAGHLGDLSTVLGDAAGSKHGPSNSSTAQRSNMKDCGAAGLAQPDDGAGRYTRVQPCGKEHHLACKQALKQSHQVI
jgi:hypothetical protein